MPTTRIAYLAVGPDAPIYIQAEYAILSALAWRKNEIEASIHVFTDHPERLIRLQNLVSLQSVSSFKADSPFFKKLEAVKKLSETYPADRVLFCDADTFFFHPLSGLTVQLNSGISLLHRREYAVSTNPLGQMKKFRRALAVAGLLETAQRIDPDLTMWNSGVLGLPPGSGPTTSQAIGYLRKLAPLLPQHYPAEQFCVGLAMQQQSMIQPADGIVFHYWYQKADYTAAIARRLHQWEPLGTEAKLSRMRTSAIFLPAPPQKQHWWERLLTRLHMRGPLEDPRGLPPTNLASPNRLPQAERQ